MFWRLFLSYLVLVAAAVGLVGVLILQRAGGTDLFLKAATVVLPAALLIMAVAVLPAYLFASRFTRPLHQLSEGAKHLAEGDFGHKIEVAGSREFAALARTFNGMTDKLAVTFAEAAHEREQLRTILSGMVEGVVAFDNDCRVLFANDRAAKLLGFPAESAVGRMLWEVTRQRAVVELVEKALAGAGPERQELNWNGPSVEILAVYVARLPGQFSPGAVVVLQDMTELRRLERIRQEFVANVSHELKTPLANIKSSVETLIDGAVEEPALRGNFLAEIDLQAHRLEALIQDLLALARIESGEAQLRFEAIPVDDAVTACLDRHRTRAEAKGLSLNGVALGNCPPKLAAWVDEEALAQILDNLVDNAIKYTPNHGRVTVRWSADEMVTLEVEDTGIGIPERDQPHVFQRFYRVDRARSRELGGTGLGLAIVKHLVQSMKGTVGVTSAVGKGTTFRVTLPRVRDEAAHD